MWYDTVINYCTIDDKFIRENIRQSLSFSKDIFIIAGSHFFDGTPEDEEKIESLKTNADALQLTRLNQLTEYATFLRSHLPSSS